MTPNSQDNDTIKAKIRALMARTVERGATEAEAIAAATLVGKLLKQHHLTLFDIELNDYVKPTIGHDFVDMGTNRGIGQGWCRVLAGAIADITFTTALMWRKSGQISFTGTETNVRAAMELYTWLADQVRFVCRSARRVLEAPTEGAAKYTWDRNFLLGCVTRIDARLQEELEKDRADCRSQALVLWSKQANDDYNTNNWKIESANALVVKEQFEHITDVGYRAGDLVQLRPVNERQLDTAPNKAIGR